MGIFGNIFKSERQKRYEKYRETEVAGRRAWREAHPKESYQHTKDWRERHREQYNEIMRDYRRRQREE
jgi:hypothetical protein